MKKNFAGQPDLVLTLTANDLTTNVNPIQYPKVFGKAPLFVDNCNGCQKNNNMMNLDGLNIGVDTPMDKTPNTFDKIFGTLQWGVGVWSKQAELDAAQKQAEAALEIQRLKSEQDASKAQASIAQSETITGKIKAYQTPIIATGVVIVGSIAAYFYFKNK